MCVSLRARGLHANWVEDDAKADSEPDHSAAQLRLGRGPDAVPGRDPRGGGEGREAEAQAGAQEKVASGTQAAPGQGSLRSGARPGAARGTRHRQLSHHAAHDLLTGLLNRQAFEAALRLEPANAVTLTNLGNALRNLGRLEGRCILVHGLDDDIIPYTESLALAEALSGCQVELHLLQGLYHVDHQLSGLDAWRFWRLVTSLLSVRP